MVAMLGPIIAAPLTMPVMVISPPASWTCRPASLWRVSVVSIPRGGVDERASSVRASDR